MKIKYECIPCVTKQLITLAEKVTQNTTIQEDIIGYGLKLISEEAFRASPPLLTGKIYDYAKKTSGVLDPFKVEKKTFNKIAQNLIRDYQLKERITMSEEPLETAIRLSIAGNIIDFSLGKRIEEHHVKKSIEDSLQTDIFGGLDHLKQAIKGSRNIMILGDNAGEIVFDQLLIDLLKDKNITYVVKGGPIVNDATLEDALEIGLDAQVALMDTGAAYQGIILSESNPAFIEALKSAELVISKGQANYETLSDYEHHNLYFLLRGKCLAVADEIGCTQGAFVCIQ